jgi:hypothetical protein
MLFSRLLSGFASFLCLGVRKTAHDTHFIPQQVLNGETFLRCGPTSESRRSRSPESVAPSRSDRRRSSEVLRSYETRRVCRPASRSETSCRTSLRRESGEGPALEVVDPQVAARMDDDAAAVGRETRTEVQAAGVGDRLRAAARHPDLPPDSERVASVSTVLRTSLSD